MNNRQTTDSIFEPVTVWHAADGGFNVFADLKAEDAGRFDFISNEYLASLDERLPEALSVMTQEHETTFGIFIRRMLSIWATQYYLDATDGRKIALCEINDMILTKNFAQFFGKGWEYKVVEDEQGTRNFMLPLESASKKTTVSREWLDKQYPGWDKRYRIAETLGVESSACIASIFSKQSFDKEIALPVNMEMQVCPP